MFDFVCCCQRDYAKKNYLTEFGGNVAQRSRKKPLEFGDNADPGPESFRQI